MIHEEHHCGKILPKSNQENSCQNCSNFWIVNSDRVVNYIKIRDLMKWSWSYVLRVSSKHNTFQ